MLLALLLLDLVENFIKFIHNLFILYLLSHVRNLQLSSAFKILIFKEPSMMLFSRALLS